MIPIVRNWFVPIGFGAIAPTVVVGVWGILVATIWVPASRYVWESRRINMHSLPVDAKWAFDAAIGAALGVALSYAIARLVHANLLRAWLLFVVSFVAAFTAPQLVAGDLAFAWVFADPLLMFFFGATVAVFAAKHFRSFSPRAP